MSTQALEGSHARSGPINRAWRILATGWSFASFGVGGLIIGLGIYPVVRLITPDPVLRRQRIQGVIQRTFGLFVKMMCRLGIMRLSVENQAALQAPGQLIIANHPTLIDVVVLISLLPRTRCVVKDALLRNPFTRGPITAAGYIPNSASAALVPACAEVLEDGESLLIFPEGTRTTPGVKSRFQRGTANVALATQAPLRPVFIDCTPSTLTKGLPWYAVPAHRFHIRVRAGKLVDVAPFRAMESRALAARRLNTELEELLWQGAQSLSQTAPSNPN